MKITVITPRFTIAGVPLAQIRLARALKKYDHKIEMIVGYIDPTFDLLSIQDISVIDMNKKTVKGMLFPICKYLLNEKPDIIFSAEDHLNVIILIAAILTKSPVKISGSSRVTPFDTYSNNVFSKRWLLKKIASKVMPRANSLTCVSKEMVTQYNEVFNNPPHKCIYNIIVDSESQKRMLEPLNHPWIKNKKIPLLVAAGKLAPWKGFEDLIYAFKELDHKLDLRLMILGDGPLREELTNLINKLNLQKKILLVGYVNNPLKYFSNADIFVLSSHVEGLPNVLVEAMMCGCTPVSTDCPTGPKEVLCDEKYGYLAKTKDPISLANKIQEAINSPIPKSILNEGIKDFHESAVISMHFSSLGISSNNTKPQLNTQD